MLHQILSLRSLLPWHQFPLIIVKQIPMLHNHVQNKVQGQTILISHLKIAMHEDNG